MSSAFRLHRAAQLIHQGGVVALPTEAVWGLSCDPLNPHAVARLLAIKQRPMHKGLILVAADIAQLAPFARIEDPVCEAARATWPGPHTWLLPAREALPDWLSGGSDRVACRVTTHPLLAALCRAAGSALVSTSANRTGLPPARSALQVLKRCPGTDLLLHGRPGGLQRPTPIRDARSGEVLRAG